MTEETMPDTKIRGNNKTILAQHILHRIFHAYTGGFTVKLWDNHKYHFGKTQSKFTLVIHSPSVVKDLILNQNPIRLAEFYFDGKLDVEGDFNSAMELRDYLEKLKLSFTEKFLLVTRALKLGSQKSKSPHLTKIHSIRKRENNIDSIAFHYDVSNDFYKLWLDKQMVYSCAYFETQQQSLDEAQNNKLDYVCRKLRLNQGDLLLDVGCGWGALVCWAAKNYGVHAHGITLSQSQYAYARNKVIEQGLSDKVKIQLLNYRDLDDDAVYDKVSSIGMFEHVGLKNLMEYFSIINRVLKPGGLFLNHGITSDEPDWKHGVSTEFINRYVFPDGELDTVSNIQRRMEDSKFEIFDVEGLRPHYAITLRHWVHRLEMHHQQAVSLVGERTYRIWRLYMTGCALQFEQGATGIYQILAEKKHKGMPKLPLTRRDLYH